MSAAPRQEWVVCLCTPGEGHPESQFLQSYDDAMRPQGPLWRSERDVAVSDMWCCPEPRHIVTRIWTPTAASEDQGPCGVTRVEHDTHFHVVMADGTHSVACPSVAEAIDHAARAYRITRGMARLMADVLAAADSETSAERLRTQADQLPEPVSILRCDVTATVTETTLSLLGEPVQAGEVQ